MRIMGLILLVSVAGLASMGGCPAAAGPSGPVAEIGLSATGGPAPFTVSVDGLGSTSTSAIVSYAWDFAGLRSATGDRAGHTFINPGRYEIRLTVTDEDGASATAVRAVRVQGDDITVRALADRTTGVAPLTVRFSAEGIELGGDVLRDFYWTFGDATDASATSPFHTYTIPGEYVVRLRATTAGGVVGRSSIRIIVTAPPDDDDDDDDDEDEGEGGEEDEDENETP